MDKDYALFKINEFIDDCYKLKNEYLLIIHGIGSGILSKATSEYLRKDKRVLEFHLDFMNPGCTVVRLKFDKVK